MENTNEIKAGLWNKQAKSGLIYLSGSIEIMGQKYWVKGFKNENKYSDKSPDMNLVLTPAEETPSVQPQTIQQTFVQSPIPDSPFSGMDQITQDIPF